MDSTFGTTFTERKENIQDDDSFRGVPQLLQENAKIILQIKPRRTLFSIYYLLTTLPSDCV